MSNAAKKCVSRRGFIRAGAALGAAALAGPMAAGTARAAAARDLRIIMPGGSWKEWVDQYFAQPFARSHKIEIIWKLGLAQEPLVMAQRNRPQWDLIHSSQARASQLGDMGLYRKLDPARLPNLAHIHENFRYEYLAGKCHTPYGLCVNTGKIKRPVDSWTDLWDPEFQGRIAFPAWGWIGDEVFHAVNVAFGGDAANIDPGIEKFKELFGKNKCRVANNVEHTRQLLDAQEIWLCPFFDARTAQARAAGTPVEFVIPKEGGMSWIWNTALVANRPQPSMDLAEQFVDTTLAAEAQIEFARKTGYPPTNVQAMENLPPDLEKLRLSQDELALLRRLQGKADYVTMFARRDQYAERWNKEVLGA